MIRKLYILPLLIALVSITPFAFGHGSPTETLPSRILDDKEVTLEVFSSPPDVTQGYRGEISFLLRDTKTDDPINETTFLIKISKDDKILVSENFEADKGRLDFEYDSNSGLLYEKENIITDLPQSDSSDIVNVFGGLYDLHIEIITADSYSNKLSQPLVYDFGLSFPSTTFNVIEDPDFGKQKIGIIAYYDAIENFQYHSQDKSISFSMPFDWPIHTQDELFFIHNEFIIPKSFGDFMVEDYTSYMNGIDTSESIFSIDYFLDEDIRIHVLTNYNHMQNLLNTLQQKNQERPDFLEFSLKPTESDVPKRIASTLGGRYEANLSWNPATIISGKETTFSLNVQNKFKENEVSIPYDLILIHDEKEIFMQSLTSPEIPNSNNEIMVVIPDEITGQIMVKIANIGTSTFSNIDIPLIVRQETDESESSKKVSQGILISNWVRNNAGWWADSKITDNDFALGIDFLIKQEIIQVPTTSNVEKPENTVIPEWVRNNAGWWAENLISDEDFVQSIEYLIQNGMITV